MSPIELVTALPNLPWTQHGQEEITMTGEELIDISDFVWQIGNAAVAGFIYRSYTSPPWMWFVLAEGTTVADLVDLRRLSRNIPQGTMTAVAAEFKVGIRFAKLYGFELTGEKRKYFDRDYLLMRKA